MHLWKIAASLGCANIFRKKKHRNHYHYGFSIKASKRRDLYNKIGPLPNPKKDKVFRHLANRNMFEPVEKRGLTKNQILQLLAKSPKTVLQLMLELKTSASTIRRHLSELQDQKLVNIAGKDKGAFQKSLRTANLWSACKET
jgi:DNA-binding transcriptional ArsR family regulator